MKQRKQGVFSGMTGTVYRSLSLAALSIAAFLPQHAAAANSEAIIDAAREEAKQGTFLVMVSSPKGERSHRVLMDAFQERFDLDLDWEWMPLNSNVSAPRIVEQAKSNVRQPSAIGGYPNTIYEHWIVGNDLDVEVDWVGDFGEIFPTIGAAATQGVLPKYHNRLIAQWNVLYVMVYNTRQVDPDEVPTSYAELTEEKWRGRFAMPNNSPSPLEYLALEMGQENVVDLTRKLVANEPRFKPGQPAVVGAVVSGEAAVAVGGYTALADAQKARGAPVDWKVLDSMPVQPLHSFMLKDAPQPNLGKLFLAWLSTEGLALQEKEEFLSLYRNEESPTRLRIQEMNPDVKLLELASDEQFDLLFKTERAVLDVLAGAAVGN